MLIRAPNVYTPLLKVVPNICTTKVLQYPAISEGYVCVQKVAGVHKHLSDTSNCACGTTPHVLTAPLGQQLLLVGYHYVDVHGF